MSTDAPIYLDHNATTPIRPEVVEAMLPYLTEHFGNPSSGHVFGARANRAVAAARAQVADLLGAHPDEVIFTSGGTEASNLAIRGALEARGGGAVLTSTIEHPATSAPCRWLETRGHPVTRVGVDTRGRLRLDEAACAIRREAGPETALITVMHANNETGVLQPISDLAPLAREAQALLHTDAAQSLGKVPVAVDELGVDLLTIAGHKLYAPKGVGALYVRRGTALAPFALGAGHERGLRPGTENVASIVALGAACALVGEELEATRARLATLRDALWTRLSGKIVGLAQNGDPQDRLPNTLNVRFPGVSGRAVLAGAPEIAASTGSACHDGGETASAVILAMGVPAEAALGSVRLSLGHGTSNADVDRAVAALVRGYAQAERA